jgi:hypothetical protein
MDIHIYFHDPDSSRKLDTLLLAVKSIQAKEIQMDADLQAIVDQAKANTDAEAAANAALNALFAKLTAAIAGSGPISAADRVALQATVKSMSDSAAALSAAIVADTPAA